MSRRPRPTKPPTESGTTSREDAVIVDPAERYYERSRKVFEEYDRAVRGGAGAGYLAETNYEGFGGNGNPRSRQAFDPRTFRRG